MASEGEEIDNRLTSKHIQTLQYLQNVLSENKELKSRIAELQLTAKSSDDFQKLASDSQEKIKAIQEQYLSRADEINQLLVAKHEDELLKLQGEMFEAEQNHMQEKEQLLQQISELSKSHDNSALQYGQLQMMELKSAALEEEAERLRTQLESAEATISNQLIELQRLHSLKEENKRLATELKEMSQQATELKFKVKSSEDMAKDKDDNRAEDMLIAMKNRLTQLNRERSVRILREKEYVSTIERQIEEKAQLVAALADAEAGNKALMQQLHQLGEQLSEMKIAQSKAAREGANFREFVQLKKELAQVKDENEQLKKEAAAAGKVNKRTSLPAITASSSSNTASMEHKAAGGADRPMPGTRGDFGELTLHQGHQGHQRKLSRSSDESLTEVVLPGAWRKNLSVKS